MLFKWNSGIVHQKGRGVEKNGKLLSLEIGMSKLKATEKTGFSPPMWPRLLCAMWIRKVPALT